MSFAMRSMPVLVLAATLMFSRPAQGQFQSAAKWVPDSANTLVLVQAKKIFDSALGKKEGWRKDQIKAFNSGAAFLPVTTERVLISAQMDLDSMQPTWKVSIFEKYGPDINIAKISEKTGGNIESISGRDAVILPNDTYFIQVDGTTLAAITPANRQLAGRWLATKATPAITLSPYLTKAMNFADNNADVILALDLEHVMDAGTIAHKLKMGGFANDNDLKPVSEALSKAQGLMLGITVNDSITGALRVDFDGDTAILKRYIKPILLEVLGRRGAMIDDLNTWNLNLTGNSAVLEGPLSETGFRQVLSLVRHSINHDLILSPGDQAAAPEQSVATVSKQYFDKLQSIVNELTAMEKDRALNTYASFFERYASEIDGFSVINVDEDMAKFGSWVSDNFRDVAGVLRDAQFSKRSMQAGMSDSFYTAQYGAYGDYGSYSYQYDNSAARRAVGVQQNAAGEKSARDILRTVSKQMGALRQGMSQKYKIDF
jgi:hypothetical protein